MSGISRDTDDTIWVTSDRNDDSYIWHLSDHSLEHWVLPQGICDDCGMAGISHDANGFPIVVNSEKKGRGPARSVVVYKWNGEGWDKIDLGVDLTVGAYSRHLNATDTRVWDTQNEALSYIDFITNTIVNVESPDEIISRGIGIQDFSVNPDDSLLVWFSGKDMPVVLYRFENEQWQKISEISISNSIRIWDLCQDFHGGIWALAENTNTHQISVGHYDEQADTWTWADLKLGQSDRSLAYFNSFAVDANDRIWLSGVYDRRNDDDNYLDFVMAFDWDENTVQPIVEYTEKNSNLKYSDFFVMTKERIWISGWRLYWIDYEELPSPYPDWVVRLIDLEDEYFEWYLPVAMGQFLLLIVAFALEKY